MAAAAATTAVLPPRAAAVATKIGGPAQRSRLHFFCSGGNLFFFEARNLQKLNRLPTDQQQIATSFLTS
jgi:hypothetical protein